MPRRLMPDRVEEPAPSPVRERPRERLEREKRVLLTRTEEAAIGELVQRLAPSPFCSSKSASARSIQRRRRTELPTSGSTLSDPVSDPAHHDVDGLGIVIHHTVQQASPFVHSGLRLDVPCGRNSGRNALNVHFEKQGVKD